eukprot:TRINITY_DN5110_c0_g1_i1.p1 TRINITY_DN5110_c0_g1~~TRINITY_DN5110_c0_g1_i1.p1  ORF type:complete len:212 (-),score=42.18 TRINITY_DN5110_c0_g1_i1:301-936(-)
MGSGISAQQDRGYPSYKVPPKDIPVLSEYERSRRTPEELAQLEKENIREFQTRLWLEYQNTDIRPNRLYHDHVMKILRELADDKVGTLPLTPMDFETSKAVLDCLRSDMTKVDVAKHLRQRQFCLYDHVIDQHESQFVNNNSYQTFRKIMSCATPFSELVPRQLDPIYYEIPREQLPKVLRVTRNKIDPQKVNIKDTLPMLFSRYFIVDWI